jgi:ribosomal protein L7/L12/predicted RNA-binding Zn-ribbon protein involved in translation (DUF1610 family)
MMNFTAAKCTQCGANIKVDKSKEAAICEHCGTAFITEKAVKNYNINYSIDNGVINISGVDINNLLLRAEQFESDGDFDRALEYYDRVLDIDVKNDVALFGVHRIKGTATSIPSLKVEDEDIRVIENELRLGNKIAAIKYIKGKTGMGLRESKDFIDSYNIGTPLIESNKIIDDILSKKDVSKEGCYIATAVYGSYDCPEVLTLRRFRDDSLRSTVFGKLLVRVYYVISPVISKHFSRIDIIQHLSKKILDALVGRLKNKGY